MTRTPQPTVPDQTGRLAVVTGASDGIGAVIARRLAEAGAELVLPVRSAEKGARAAARLRDLVPGVVVRTAPLDLADLASVRGFAADLVAAGRPVDLLVANAGVMRPPRRQETADGHELQWGTNHLGHVALTLGLLPLLRSGRGRVVHQTSVAARRGSIAWDDVDSREHYDVMRAYAASKVANGLFARELDARSRAGGWGVTSVLAHPGISPTNLLAAQPGLGRDRGTPERRVVTLLSRLGVAGTVESAALPALVAATDPTLTGGEFFGPRRLVGGPPARRAPWTPFTDAEQARRLWDVSLAAVGVPAPA